MPYSLDLNGCTLYSNDLTLKVFLFTEFL